MPARGQPVRGEPTWPPITSPPPRTLPSSTPNSPPASNPHLPQTPSSLPRIQSSAAAPMENQPPQQVQGPIQPPAPAARIMRAITHEDIFEAYRYIKVKRVGLPLPKRAPKVEATEFRFDKHKHATGSALGDLLKRSAFGVQDLIGDKRREILHLLPLNKKNKQQINTLGHQLTGLRIKLNEKIVGLERDAGITLEAPLHFKGFPALEG